MTRIVGSELARQLRALLRLQGQPQELHAASDVLPVVLAGDVSQPPYESITGGFWGGVSAGVVMPGFALWVPVEARGVAVIKRATIRPDAVPNIVTAGVIHQNLLTVGTVVAAPRWRQGVDQDETPSQAAGVKVITADFPYDMAEQVAGQKMYAMGHPNGMPHEIVRPWSQVVIEPGSVFVMQSVQAIASYGMFYWDWYEA